MKGILGRKVGMTQLYEETGEVVPVTVIQAGPCYVLQIRTAERDGYPAVQLGFLDKPRRLASRSERGHVARLSSKRSRQRLEAGVEVPAKPDCEPQRFIREFRGPADGFQVGQQVTVESLAEVKAVDVTGTSKGRGFAGVIKRHHFSGQRATHGVKKVHRHPGSTGSSADPSRIFKGRRMAGHLGHVRVTIRNLKVVRVDVDQHLLLVRGAVPGPNGGLLVISESHGKG
jgi:large subunit ribosomal protein L3